MNSKHSRIKHLFAVEIWREASQSETGPWRGIVKHVAHDRQTYFQNLGALTDFISLRLAATPDPPEKIEP
ncbi:MAG: hypothetical protein M3126_00555 [Candidatus Eremiobacteraeota bacterium]|nr:hypothetical protein [Candidatus Eremiobacteraeota bacterium]